MTALNQTILTAFEDLGLQPSDIADQYGLEPAAVKTVLIQFSTKFRNLVKKSLKAKDAQGGELITTEPGRAGSPSDLSEYNPSETEMPDVTDDEYQELLAAYKDLALTSENDSVREKGLRFLINEKKGRNNVVTNLKDAPQQGALHFTQIIQQAKERAQQARVVTIDSSDDSQSE